MKATTPLLLCAVLSTLTAIPAFAKEPRSERGKPPSVAIDACSTAAEDATCEFTGRGDRSVIGICHTVPSGELACVPEGHRRDRQGAERSDSNDTE